MKQMTVTDDQHDSTYDIDFKKKIFFRHHLILKKKWPSPVTDVI